MAVTPALHTGHSVWFVLSHCKQERRGAQSAPEQSKRSNEKHQPSLFPKFSQSTARGARWYSVVYVPFKRAEQVLDNGRTFADVSTTDVVSTRTAILSFERLGTSSKKN